MTTHCKRSRRPAALAAAVVLAAGLGLPHAAQAWWRGGGWGWGGGLFVGVSPPVFVVPPVVFAPPPVVFVPPPVLVAPPPARSCFAGPFVCPLDRPTPPGAGCSCPTNTGRIFGQAR